MSIPLAAVEFEIGPLTLPRNLPENGPMVSVLISCNQRSEPFLTWCLRSVLAQSYRDLEIVVVDDCPVEHHIAVDDSRVTVERATTPLGDRGAFLRAYELSTGPLVKPLLAADRLHPTAIGKLVAALHSDPANILATSKRVHVDQDGVILPDTPETVPIEVVDVLLRGTRVGNNLITGMLNTIGEPSTLLWQRDDMPPDSELFVIGGKSPEGHLAEMWVLKLLARGKIAYLVEPLAQVRRRQPQLRLDEIVSYLALIDGSKQLGYLSDLALERDALCNLLRYTLADPALIGAGGHMQIDKLVDIQKSTVNRIGDLIDTIFESAGRH